MQSNLKSLEKDINVSFKDKKLLKKSLIHKSSDTLYNNEKLEFLGDRVLGLIISKNLLEIFPDDKEGNLDKKLASLVNKKKIYEVSKNFTLEKYILTGNINSKNIKIESKIVSDACEALIGAIYLDQGLGIAEKFILKFWKKEINSGIKNEIDSKTKLQEYSLKKYKLLPNYRLFDNSGPKHKPSFKIGVKLKNLKYVVATGSSKKDAEQKAAGILIKKIGI